MRVSACALQWIIPGCPSRPYGRAGEEAVFAFLFPWRFREAERDDGVTERRERRFPATAPLQRRVGLRRRLAAVRKPKPAQT